MAGPGSCGQELRVRAVPVPGISRQTEVRQGEAAEPCDGTRRHEDRNRVCQRRCEHCRNHHDHRQPHYDAGSHQADAFGRCGLRDDGFFWNIRVSRLVIRHEIRVGATPLTGGKYQLRPNRRPSTETRHIASGLAAVLESGSELRAAAVRRPRSAAPVSFDLPTALHGADERSRRRRTRSSVMSCSDNHSSGQRDALAVLPYGGAHSRNTCVTAVCHEAPKPGPSLRLLPGPSKR